MHKNPVITIARQFGSGGHQVGRLVAEKLGIKVYDKELILLAAEKSGYHPDVLSKADERAAGSLLYTLAVGASRMGGLSGNYDIPINDKLFIAQNEPVAYVQHIAGMAAARTLCGLPAPGECEGIFRRCSGKTLFHAGKDGAELPPQPTATPLGLYFRPAAVPSGEA